MKQLKEYRVCWKDHSEKVFGTSAQQVALDFHREEIKKPLININYYGQYDSYLCEDQEGYIFSIHPL